ncbi:MAG TPA: MarR family winged helix-turn-helix transcriptional regulator [Pirellulales bacterium]
MNDSRPEMLFAAHCLAGRVRVLNRVITSIYDDALRPFGVRVSQMGILTAIAAAGPLRQVDVCKLLHLEKSTLSRDLERLLESGWVCSTKGKGRAVNLEITPAGRDMLASVVPAWHLAQAKATELLTPAGVAGIFKALGGLWNVEE